MSKEQEVNELGRKLASGLISNGIKAMRMSFHLDPVEYTDVQLKKVLNNAGFTGLSLYDSKYHLIEWYQWRQIIEADWINYYKWLAEFWDCDDFARSFSSHVSEIFHINTAGMTCGQIYDVTSGSLIGGHCFNVLPATGGGETKLYIYEPMYDYYCLYEKGQPIILGDWRYVPTWISF